MGERGLTELDAAEVLLVHRRAAGRPAIVRVVVGTTGFVLVLVGVPAALMWIGHAGTDISTTKVICFSAIEIALLGLTGWLIVHGVAGLIAWRREHRQPTPAMRLSRTGVDYTVAHRSRFDVHVSWDDVVGCAIRPDLVRQPVFCVDLVDPTAGPEELRANTVLFGTPLVINLARCEPVPVDELDRLVRHWTDDRCGCDPVDWWAGAGK